MRRSRRNFIRVAGGGVVLGAGALALARCDGMPDSAVAAWSPAAPAAAGDVRRQALAYAILAPNPHNIQPWLVDLSEPDTVVLHVDRTRLLPMTDPPNRQIVIGHGTFLELLDIAAREEGHRLEITPFPDGQFGADSVDDRPVARIRFVPDPSVARDLLFAQALRRRSTKTPYDTDRPLSADHRTALSALLRMPEVAAAGCRLHLADDPETAADLREITGAAVDIEMQTPRTHRESIDLLRIGAAEIAAHRDGIDLHGPMFWWMKRLGLMTREKAMTPGTMAWQGGVDYARGWVAGTGAFGWLTTEANDRMAQLAAGRLYMRLDLTAAALGVAIHPVSQVLQEYPEMAALQEHFRTRLDVAPGQSVQMLYRLGYAAAADPAPRRGVEAIVRQG
ncbi:Acg family FMN-binding oxidoreductase [Marinibaculum pumilum]|uniref:Acg family FMN-binding oxidoreductase n=1 Tax=Marinibaculum pumilum TaxID=1766165 RepID=A0ABV7KV65_9PROT